MIRKCGVQCCPASGQHGSVILARGEIGPKATQVPADWAGRQCKLSWLWSDNDEVVVVDGMFGVMSVYQRHDRSIRVDPMEEWRHVDADTRPAFGPVGEQWARDESGENRAGRVWL